MDSKKAPSREEIQAHLDGLNVVYQAWLPTREAEAAMKTGFANYREWFEKRGIKLLKNERTGEWKLASEP